MSLRDGAIDLGFRVFGATGLHRAAAPLARGLGAILMFHRVRHAGAGAYAPNRGLEITPAFLDAILADLRRRRIEIVTLDEATKRLSGSARGPFVALTFDDGTRDTLQVALPVLQRHAAPATVFITTGFAERTARMWWLELEAAIGALEHVAVDVGGTRIAAGARSPHEKADAFRSVYRALRAASEADLLAACQSLCDDARLDPAAIVDEACLDWAGVRTLAASPLVTIGAHTVTHPRLARLEAAAARAEVEESRDELESALGRAVRHLAYPVGDPASAGAREFATARASGFASAVTTRPGMLFGAHRDHLTALPRLSINGGHQSLRALDILLSGVPFLLMNGGRRLSVA